MNAFSMLSTLSPEFKVKLEEVRTRAELADTGTANFLEITGCPVTSLYLISGNKKEDGSNKKEIHMSFEQEPSGFPSRPKTDDECEKEGYRMYLTKIKNDYDLGKTDVFSGIRFDEWKVTLREIRDCIDMSIKLNHGIKCFQDGNLDNDDIRNVYYMHVCDVMNVYSNRKNGTCVTLFLKSKLLEEIALDMKDVLTNTILTGKYLKFWDDNLDYLYTNYAYHGNGSMLPIRTHVPENDKTFIKSSFFTNNVHFAKHQRGKLNWVNQTQKGTMCACVFRSY
jgi:hypothetical protein